MLIGDHVTANSYLYAPEKLLDVNLGKTYKNYGGGKPPVIINDYIYQVSEGVLTRRRPEE